MGTGGGAGLLSVFPASGDCSPAKLEFRGAVVVCTILGVGGWILDV